MMQKVAALGVAVGLAAGAAQAETYFSEDMEDYAPGTELTSATPTHNGGAWLVSGGDDPDVTRTIVADPTGAGQGNVLEVVDDSDGNHRFAVDLNQNSLEPLLFEFDFYVDTGSLGAAVNHGGSEDGIFWQMLVYTLWESNGQRFRYKEDNVWTRNVDGLDGKTWHHVEIETSEFTPTGKTASVRVVNKETGETVVELTGLSFNYDDAGGYEILAFGHPSNPNTGRYLLDNISVSVVPEPGTFAVLGTLAPLTLMRRLRSR